MALDLTLKGPNAIVPRVNDDNDPFDLSVRAPKATSVGHDGHRSYHLSAPWRRHSPPNPGSQETQPKLHIPKAIKAQPLWGQMDPYTQAMLRLEGPPPREPVFRTPTDPQPSRDLRLCSPPTSHKGQDSKDRAQSQGNLTQRPHHPLYPQVYHHHQQQQQQQYHHGQVQQRQHHRQHYYHYRHQHQQHHHPYMGVFKEISSIRNRTSSTSQPEVFFECVFGADGKIKVQRREGHRRPSASHSLKSVPPQSTK